ncbi:MAG: hypothetical protein DRP56_04755, partial [Planctomycetota bacterium]
GFSGHIKKQDRICLNRRLNGIALRTNRQDTAGFLRVPFLSGPGSGSKFYLATATLMTITHGFGKLLRNKISGERFAFLFRSPDNGGGLAPSFPPHNRAKHASPSLKTRKG